MKRLEMKEMEQIEAGGFWGGVACLAAAATVTVATGNPLFGLGTNIVCQAFINPTPAY